MELTAQIHFEEGAYWAEIKELPGCFASGRTLDELLNESLREAISLYLTSESDRDAPSSIAVGEMKLVVSP